MSLSGTMTQSSTMDVVLDGVELGQMQVVDEWEGMVKLSCPRHGVLIVAPKSLNDGPMGSVFAGLFKSSSFASHEVIEFVVMLVSPGITQYVKEVQAKMAEETDTK